METRVKLIIYIYVDKWNDDRVVYVGKDSNGHIQKRHKEHLTTKRPTKFERILQANPSRYRYIELLEILEKDWLDDIEGILIWALQRIGVADLNQVEGLDRTIIEVLNGQTTTE